MKVAMLAAGVGVRLDPDAVRVAVLADRYVDTERELRGVVEELRLRAGAAG